MGVGATSVGSSLACTEAAAAAAAVSCACSVDDGWLDSSNSLLTLFAEGSISSLDVDASDAPANIGSRLMFL